MSNIVVLNTKTGADYTCSDCGSIVAAAIHHGEPCCLPCRFLRLIPIEHREEVRRRHWPYTVKP